MFRQNASRLKVLRRAAVFMLGVFVLTATSYACNIPVFRYALERWNSDSLELIVFQDHEFSPVELESLDKLRTRSVAEGGNLNLEIQVVETTREVPAQYQSLWESLRKSATSEPTADGSSQNLVAVRGNHVRGAYIPWTGTLVETKSLIDSPVRAELTRRLIAGDSIVWCIVGAQDAQQTQSLREMLGTQIDDLSSKVELPEGIGLPGSELFSEVPLLLKYSILEVERDDPRESFLLSLIKGFQADAFARGEALVVPVFGRGRALEVIPASQLSPALVRDLTQFLCAACSCQVKDQNPGFDLLIHKDWDTALFGTDGDRPPASEEGLGQQQQPQLLTIPPGR